MTPQNRTPVRAALLSLVVPGLGQVYTGRLVPGLAVIGAAAALGPLAALAVRVAPSHGMVWVIAGAFGWVVLLVGSAMGAFCAAVRDPTAAPPREVDRWYVYAVLAMIAVPSALGWAATVNGELVALYYVPTASMLPTIEPGSRLLVDRGAYARGPLCRGDVVVIRNPDQPYQFHVKRVVALPGDHVELRATELFVGGAHQPRPAGRPVTHAGEATSARSESPPIDVPHGHCFVLGDAREHAVDSRDYGPVPLGNVVGRVTHIWHRGLRSLPREICRTE
ncbi:MAG: signal peptidase I [Polyangiaceae bacterium]|nr:signal peptidase I [Polyangiaceae bacterium]